MTRRRVSTVLLWSLAMAGTGCFTVQHAYHGDKYLTNGPGLDRPTHVVDHFDEHDRQFFFLHGGVPVGEPLNALQTAADAAGDHPGVVNLEVSDGQDLFDIVVTHVPCVLSILCGTWSTWVEGDVVDFDDAAAVSREVVR